MEAEPIGLSWCYWDFGTDFGAFNPQREAWREPLRDALFAPVVPSRVEAPGRRIVDTD
jgi:hypothetical protein